MRLQAPGVSKLDYFDRLERGGGVVEERIVARELRSPSVQLELAPGEPRIVSTHDQIVSDDMCVGCRFPADPAYAADIMASAARVGEHLAAGVLGRFAIDFISVRRPDGGWDSYAIEINLRKGGTTHPFLTLQFLTDGRYDPASGVFTTPRGEAKCFVASDHAEPVRALIGVEVPAGGDGGKSRGDQAYGQTHQWQSNSRRHNTVPSSR